MRVLGFGTYDSSRQPRSAVLLEGLRAHGAQVSELNRPLGFSSQERVEMLQRPFLVYRLVLRLLARWSSLVVGRWRPWHRPDVVIVGYLAQFDVVLARLLFPRATIVLDLLVFADDTARDRGVEAGLRTRALRLLDRAAVKCADVVMVDTEENAEMVPGMRPVLVVPVGAGRGWFETARRPKVLEERPLQVIFFGIFTPLQGTPLIAQALATLPPDVPLSLTMVGVGQEYDAVRSALEHESRVKWIPWVPEGELPDLVAEHDVCLGIFGSTPKALRVTPTKVYQGAAAGCAIITSDTAPQRRALGDAAVFVAAGDASALSRALRDLANNPQEVARLARMAHERALAEFQPDRLARDFLSALDEHRPNRSRP